MIEGRDGAERKVLYWRVAAAFSAALLAFITYANTLDGDWVWDDASSVLLHESVQDPSRVLQLFTEDQHAYGRGQGNFYRPLVATSFMLDYMLSGGVAEGANEAGYPQIPVLIFHVTNILWHAAASILLFLVLLKLGAALPVAWIVAAIFTVHPLHTEAVAYISGRADMMSGAFMFGGLLLGLHGARRGSALVALLCAVAFTGGMLSKESTAMFPFLLAMLLGLGFGSDKASSVSLFKRYLPVVFAGLALAIYAVLRMTVLRFSVGSEETPAALTQRLVETGQAFAFYLQKLFVPTQLHMEQSLAGTPGWTAIPGYMGMALLLLLAVLAYRLGHKRITAGIAWFLLTWLPISGIFPLNAPMAEHWMYVPMAGFWWALVEFSSVVIKRIPQTRLIVAPAGLALGLCFVALAVQRNAEWHDNDSLFRATIRENPATMRVHFNLAVTYEDLDNNFAGARRHFREALALKGGETAPGTRRAIRPDDIEIYLSLGNLAYALHDYEEALTHYRLVASLQRREGIATEIALAAIGAGKSLLALGETGAADRYFVRALELEPGLRGELERIMEGAPLHG